MKRITSILTLLVACFATVCAQLPTGFTQLLPADIVAGKRILLQAVDQGHQNFFNGELAKKADAAYDATNVYLVEDGTTDGTIVLKRESDNQYVAQPAGNSTVTMTTDKAAAAPFTMLVPTGTETNGDLPPDRDMFSGVDKTKIIRFVTTLTGGTTTTYLNSNTATAVAKWAAGTGGFSVWYVWEYQEQQAVTYNYTDQYGYSFSLTKNVSIGEDAKTAAAIDFYTINTVDVETIAEGTTEVNVGCTANFPFKPATITDGAFGTEVDVWYSLKSRDCFAVYESDELVSTTSATAPFDKKALWAFVRVDGTPGTFKIYNLEAGATKPLGISVGTDETGLAGFATTNTTQEFLYKTNSYGFVLQSPDNSQINLGKHGTVEGTPNAALGYWRNGSSAGDSGSAFAIYAANDLAQAFLVLPNAEGYTTDDYVGTYSNVSEALTTASDNYKANRTLETLEALMTAGADGAPGRVDLDPAKFYQIISYKDVQTGGMALYSNAYCDANGGNSSYGDRGILIGLNPAVAASAMQFLANGQIQHANSKYYFANLNAFNDMGQVDLPINPANNGDQSYVVANAQGMANVWSLRTQTSEVKFLHSNGSGAGNVICRNENRTDLPEVNDGCLWMIKEIREVPVTIGASKWATLCLPMAVTIPTDAEGLHVYYASAIENNAMTLTEVSAGTILPKNTPVLLYSTTQGESDTYNFAVTTEEGTTIDGNLLKGSTARRLMSNTDYYGLGYFDDVVAFYPATSEKVAANKAYLLAFDVPAAAAAAEMLTFNFGETSGIEGIESESRQPTTYYDLQGRRVLFPAGGVFITNTGKKVLFK